MLNDMIYDVLNIYEKVFSVKNLIKNFYNFDG